MRLLVADDSALMRRLIGDTFSRAGGFELAFARDGAEALALAHSFAPDVVTLDVEMPNLDGLTCLDRLMVERPSRVVMVSGLTTEGAEATLKALELGAVGFVQKPQGPVSLAMESFGPQLVEAVRAAAEVQLRPALRLADRIRRQVAGATARRERRLDVAPAGPAKACAATTVVPRPGAEGVVLVGCSTGGPPALEMLLCDLPGEFAWPIVVAQHMPASFTGALARRLDRLCALEVREVAGAELLSPGGVYIARGDADAVVSRRGDRLAAVSVPPRPEGRWRPSVDRLVESAMAVTPAEQLVGVLMTGMGDDGAAAMAELHRRGGRTLAEAEETAVVWGMPGALVQRGGAGEIAPLDGLAGRLLQAVGVR